MTPAAEASFWEAWNSPSAVMMRERRSRSASACRDIDRFMESGRATSLISTRSISMPQPTAGLSIMRARPWLSRSRLDSRSSSSLLPMIDRSDVCATWDTANSATSRVRQHAPLVSIVGRARPTCGGRGSGAQAETFPVVPDRLGRCPESSDDEAEQEGATKPADGDQAFHQHPGLEVLYDGG